MLQISTFILLAIIFTIALKVKDIFLRKNAYDEICNFFGQMDITVLEAKEVSQVDWLRMGVSTMQMAFDVVIRDEKDGKIHNCQIIFGGIMRGPWLRRLEIIWGNRNSSDTYYL